MGNLKKAVIGILAFVLMASAYNKDQVIQNTLLVFNDADYVIEKAKKYKIYDTNFNDVPIVIVYGIVKKKNEDGKKVKVINYCIYKNNKDVLSMYDYGEIPFRKGDIELLIIKDLEKTGSAGVLR